MLLPCTRNNIKYAPDPSAFGVTVKCPLNSDISCFSISFLEIIQTCLLEIKIVFFGNKKLIPAGPLRQPLKTGLDNVDAIILIGKDQRGIIELIPEGKPVFKARITLPDSWIYNQEMPYVAFAGMGQPEKFHSTLWSKGINVTGWHTFPDHHIYTEPEWKKLVAEAKSKGARLITTEKDAVRIPSAYKSDIALDVVPVTLEWEDPEKLAQFLVSRIEASG